MSHETLTVRLGERSYPIHIGPSLGGLIRSDLAVLASSKRPVAVVADFNLSVAQPALLSETFAGLPSLVLPSGEATKCVERLGEIWRFLAQNRLDRGGVVVALGGGVTGDLAGFAAASHLRGVDLLQVPTTLLSMVDSSVGGKTGINLPEGKNLVGAFHQPQAVYADTSLLATLPPREFAAGMAEVLKYGLLADGNLFAQLERDPVNSHTHPALPALIRRCCEIKAAVVAEDERETAAEGGRALLNLGHTFGHAVEAVAGYGDYLHGEAVGLGLVLAARLSQELGFIGAAEVDRTRAAVAAHHLPVRLRKPLPVNKLLDVMARDKKVRQGRLRFVTMSSLGVAQTTSGVEPTLVEKLWREAGAE